MPHEEHRRSAVRESKEQLEHESASGVHSTMTDKGIVAPNPGAPPMPREEPPEMAKKVCVRKIPLIEWAQAGHEIDFEDVVDARDFISLPSDDPKAVAIRVRGDSMAPEILDGDIVVVAPSHPCLSGKPVVVRTVAAVMLRNYRWSGHDHHELVSTNEIYPTIVLATHELVWMYPVGAIIHFS
jgi:phage repressor protein C with HTH and peptisase S24 domain